MPTYIVDSGLAIAVARLKGVKHDGSAQPEPVFASWGTAGTPATSKSDGGLSTEVGNQTGTRVAGTSSIPNGGAKPYDTYQVVATLTATAPISVTNAGLFDAASGGSLFLKGDFSAQALNAGDAIQFTFSVSSASA